MTRLAELPDVKAIGAQFADVETKNGGVKQLSVRDTTRGAIGAATFTIDYGRPLARGREPLGNHPFRTIRCGAPVRMPRRSSRRRRRSLLAGLQVPAGIVHAVDHSACEGDGCDCEQQTGQWGTGLQRVARPWKGTDDDGVLTTPVEKFTISLVSADAHHGTLTMEWGSFRWVAPVVVSALR